MQVIGHKGRFIPHEKKHSRREGVSNNKRKSAKAMLLKDLTNRIEFKFPNLKRNEIFESVD